jgi:adenylate kinase family enzyme
MNKQSVKKKSTKRMIIKSFRGKPTSTYLAQLKRIEEFKNNVIPSMNYFKDKVGYEIYTINGEQSREDVFTDIKKALDL